MAQLVLTYVGAAIGAEFGMPQLGAILGAMVGGAVDRALAPDPADQFGPRLDQLKVTSSAYGMPQPYHFGTTRTAGNIIWAEDLHEVENRTETDVGKGGPTQTTITYSYFATFAVSLGIGPGRGIRRIWANGVMVFDATLGASNPDAVALDFTFYPGTPDQLPDSTMEAAIGVGMVPGYRDEIIVVFREAPLEKFGNRIPSFEMELIMEGEWGVTDLALLNTPSADAYRATAQAIDGSVIGVTKPDSSHIQMTRFDPVTGETLASEPYAMALAGSVYSRILYVPPTNEIWLAQSGSGGGYERFDATTLEHTGTVAGVDGFFSAGPLYYDRTLRRVIGLSGINPFFGAAFVEYDLDGTLLNNLGMVTFSQYLTGGGAVVAVGTVQSGGFVIYNPAVIPTEYDPETRVPIAWVNPQVMTVADVHAYGVVFDPTRNRYIGVGDHIWTFDDSLTPNPTQYDPAGYSPGIITGINYVGGLDVVEIFSTHITTTWVTVLDAGTFEVLFDTGIGSTIGGYSVEGAFANSQLFPGVAFMVGSTQPWTVDLYGTTYAAAVRTLCLASEVLQDSDIDVSDLGQRLHGYSVVTPGPVRAAVEQLSRADFFDCVEVDDVLAFPRRGGPTVAAIELDDCGAAIDKSQDSAMSWTRAQELDLPARLYISAIDPYTDYQVGTQPGERLAQLAGDEETEQYAIVLTVTESKRLADARLYDRWASREGGQIATARKFALLVPTDPFMLDGRRARILSRSDDGGVIRFDWVIDDADVITQLSLGAQGAFTPQTVAVQVPTNLMILDTALLRDGDNSPGAYVAAWGLAPYWRGMSLFESGDGGVTFTAKTTLGAPGTPVGRALNALGDWAGGNRFDEGNTLTVQMQNGAPAGTTRELVLGGANPLALSGPDGWEILQFRDATLNGDGSYTLSGLLRGRRGTEWAMSGHAIGDRVVLLSSALMRSYALDAADLGVARLYKPVTVGDTLAATTSQSATVQGERLKPFAPVDLRAVRDVATGDITLTWRRRPRLSYRFLAAGISAPLSEAGEGYAVTVFSDNTYATPVRSIVASTNAVLYSSIDQVLDFGSNQSTVYVTVTQTSAVVGAGHELQGAA